MSEKQFNREAVKRWRRDVWKELHRLGFQNDTDAYMGLVVIAVASFGTGVKTLAELTGRDEAFVKDVLRRMRRARILRSQSLSVLWDDKGFAGSLALGLDIMATVGLIARVASPKRVAGRKRAKPRIVNAKRRAFAVVSPSAIFTPKIRKGDAWYQSAKKP